MRAGHPHKVQCQKILPATCEGPQQSAKTSEDLPFSHDTAHLQSQIEVLAINNTLKCVNWCHKHVMTNKKGPLAHMWGNKVREGKQFR